jgi:peptidoglycan/LPS O-acetylase OafA/YrhL
MSAQMELRALTSARGIAAWLVVLYHIRQSLPPVPAPVMAVLDKGYLAVDFFFVLSGFVIALAWRDRIAAAGWRAVPAFLRRRFARVWPLHAFVLTGGVGLAIALWATGRHDPADFPFVDLPLHYLLIQNWGLAPLAWNEPAWSISAEAFAYLVFPLLVFAAKPARWPDAALIALAIGIAGSHAGILALKGMTVLGRDIPLLGVPRCLTGFAIGGILFELWQRHRGARRLLPVAIVVGSAAITGAAAGVAETLAVPIGFAGLLLILATTAGRPGHPLEGAILHRLGEWSYATYLAHYLMWKAFKLVFVADMGSIGWPMIGLFVGLVLAASAALYHGVELPAQAWLNGRRQRERAAAQTRTPALP